MNEESTTPDQLGARHLLRLFNPDATFLYHDTSNVGLIYFIGAGDSGPVKIGYTTNLVNRLESLQTGNAEELKVLATIIGTQREEHNLQATFAEHHLRGEWFERSNTIELLLHTLKHWRKATRHEAGQVIPLIEWLET